MANKISVQEYIAKEALRGLWNNSTLIANCDRKYSKEFAKEGAKVGRKINVRKPARFVATKGKAYQPQAIEEDELTITLGETTGVHFELDLQEATLDIDMNKADYSKRVIMPAGHSMGALAERDGYKLASTVCNNTIMLSTAPTLKDFNRAKSYLDVNLAPPGNRNAAICSGSEVELTDSLKTLYHNQAMVDAAILKGEITEAVGLRWLTSQLTYIHTNGGGVGKTITVTLNVSGSEAATATLGGTDKASAKVGDTLKLGVKLVNPETKDAMAVEAKRTIKSIAGDVITFSEKIVWSGNGKNVSAQPSSVTFEGTAGADYQVDLVYHRDAIALINPDLYLPKDEGKLCWRTDGEFSPNLSILYVRDYGMTDTALMNRLDSQIDWAIVRPEWVTRVMSPIT